MEQIKYDDKKESGVHWLPTIPSHWDMIKISHMAILKSGVNITAVEMDPSGDYLVYGGNGTRGRFHSFTHDGDFVLIGRQGALCGNINYASGKFWASEHAIVVTPDREVNTFWLGETLRVMNLGNLSTAAAQPGISVEVINQQKLPYPPLQEQNKIASFIQKKSAKIDNLIKKKKEIIGILKKQREALIYHSVTKGLDSEVRLKESDTHFLGKIPAHWEVKRLKFMSSIKNGTDYKHVEIQDYEDGHPVYGSGGVFRKANKYLHDGPSVLYGRKGTIDKPLLVYGKFWTVDTMFYSVPEKNVSPEYMYYFSLTIQYRYLSTQTALPSITQSDLENYFCCCPPYHEQLAIKDYLDTKVSAIDKVIAQHENAISKLIDYRSASIIAAITGQIDVRKED
ncbi:restriction endonuclease subunit S [Pseudoalteromonas sp. Cn5-37]|uniref:restriction endonuclease subunit S n=1 Tax=Pseudoalteromonas sp. Cn5-37 TaxID=2908886 RepID=UPI001F45026B|nr:restriction endonuclease subunit S [Pseudoalteromonas sp. Cn5-37]MCF2918263.1 restriction endonuclease subunit S [Pseudoalteromonas sp. Cn5-37]